MNNSREYNWYRKSIRSSNQYCLYCGRFIGKGSEIPSNREHLIGREFVPSGSFKNSDSFNFIFRACVQDNNKKSIYERHISSITLLHVLGTDCDREIKDLAIRKATKDYHPRKKGVKIAESQEKIEFKYSGQNFNMTFGLISPPQAEREYVKHLSFMQMQALFSFITTPRPYDNNKLIFLAYDKFCLLGYWPKSDWGNSVLKYFSEMTLEWNCYANIDTANGYFKTIIRVDPDTKVWFWALEWNRSYRVAGFIGAIDIIESIKKDVPEEPWKEISQEGTHIVRIKSEIVLDPLTDKLFVGEVVE